jgi:2-polyprenyl-3-methyl-5-hydroxy-6-metoxy-1,4-benzoquinol methylase
MKNSTYWNNEGAQKTFTHPVDFDWLKDLTKKSTILDFGCGYGRLTEELRKAGFNHITGYDSSNALIKRALMENPHANYFNNIKVLDGKLFDIVLCFALFTSCPANSEQAEIVNQINQHTQKGAFLYISDYLMADNLSYEKRYNEKEFGILGCFKSSKAIFRHHQAQHFDKLFHGWKKVSEKTLVSTTLNANSITIHQYLYQKMR